MKHLSFIALAAIVLVGAGCVVNDNPPVVEDELGIFEVGYYVCEEADTKDRIYKTLACGDDSCLTVFYDADGEPLEKPPEIHALADEEVVIETRAENCVRTTEDYFLKRVTIQ